MKAIPGFVAYVALCLLVVACAGSEGRGTAKHDDNVSDIWDARFHQEAFQLVSIPTYSDADDDNSQKLANLAKTQRLIEGWAREFAEQLGALQLEPFEWKGRDGDREYWLFGLRIGSSDEAARRLAMILHLDTVPPGDPGWRPFEPRIELRDYRGQEDVEFLVGRGSVDNKGPAVAALVVLRALAERYEGTDGLEDVAVELIFDTSEETDMATPHYLADPSVRPPDFGIVFDAMWCIRAEKGIERPTFRIAKSRVARSGLWIESLESAPGPTNQIPAWAKAVIRSDDPQALERFRSRVARSYREHRFDDGGYRPARLDEPGWRGNAIELVTRVDGAQHGSAPQQNRADGANPLVSLANFLGALVENGELEENAVGVMAEFVRWAWGTTVFGERHPELLRAQDEVFEEGNGTSYAVTKLDADESEVVLAVDIRYAIDHHSVGWDGSTEGLLPGPSRFDEVFTALTNDFNRNRDSFDVSFDTRTAFGPDIRNPKSQAMSRINRAYRSVTNRDCSFRAIGGGTDAKGHPELLAVGPLFSNEMGPPINYHGIDEGAPVPDLKTSAEILYRAMVNEIEATEPRP